MLIKILLILFIIFVISRVAMRYKDKAISLQELILWTIFWFIVALLMSGIGANQWY